MPPNPVKPKVFVSASSVQVGDTLCFANPPQDVVVEEISHARSDGSVGFHANDGTWSSFYKPLDRLRVRRAPPCQVAPSAL